MRRIVNFINPVAGRPGFKLLKILMTLGAIGGLADGISRPMASTIGKPLFDITPSCETNNVCRFDIKSKGINMLIERLKVSVPQASGIKLLEVRRLAENNAAVRFDMSRAKKIGNADINVEIGQEQLSYNLEWEK